LSFRNYEDLLDDDGTSISYRSTNQQPPVITSALFKKNYGTIVALPNREDQRKKKKKFSFGITEQNRKTPARKTRFGKKQSGGRERKERVDEGIDRDYVSWNERTFLSSLSVLSVLCLFSLILSFSGNDTEKFAGNDPHSDFDERRLSCCFMYGEMTFLSSLSLSLSLLRDTESSSPLYLTSSLSRLFVLLGEL